MGSYKATIGRKDRTHTASANQLLMAVHVGIPYMDGFVLNRFWGADRSWLKRRNQRNTISPSRSPLTPKPKA